MNCPSRTEPEVPDKYNQSPNALAADSTTRSDLGRIASARLQRGHRLKPDQEPHYELDALQQPPARAGSNTRNLGGSDGAKAESGEDMLEETLGIQRTTEGDGNEADAHLPFWRRRLRRMATVLMRYSKFIGPGFMISVAYIDPGNYATDVAAGASYRFKLLFMVLLSNIFAIFLQSLCIKLGTVTGLNLAEMCKAHLPPWLNYLLYFFAESAIIATDIAEVIGTAIALELLSNGKIPLVAGCAISIVDVLFILLFYRPGDGSMRALRAFEIFVALLVIGVVVCFCFQLSLIEGVSIREVFRGYAPSSALVTGRGLYQACGILGATVMPHSLYLGSGIIQARLKDFDEHKGAGERPTSPADDLDGADEEDDDPVLAEKYRPSLQAIKSCMSYSIAELAISLFTFALFVNSAILIVAGSSLSSVAGADNATLFGIHDLLSRSLAPAAGTIFALALLLSGLSAGIVCTIAGQMVSEGQLSLKISPWLRRLMTRSISITPSIIVAGALGKAGVSQALEGTQFALSVILPFVSAPLIYFTCRDKYMTVGGATPHHKEEEDSVVARERSERRETEDRSSSSAGGVSVQRGVGSDDASRERAHREGAAAGVKMANHWVTAAFAVAIWLVIVIMNVASLVLVGLGVS
ncbi:hypothetical protein LTR36_002524 [Oleoguttula mirabilis]|uniref:Natural resistance-associated macrophage protein n=1 Tax=Oleoguttula mirabilis TaxID=1507867 RepID=A0AAV9JL07_9PEZI|nr:hypothetical protein LTR36_002524 [Oleoguttula mirabilis]